MHDLHVDSELAAVVVENKDTDGAAARLESSLEAGPEVGLLNDRKTGLDITGLAHGNDCREFVSVFVGIVSRMAKKAYCCHPECQGRGTA